MAGYVEYKDSGIPWISEVPAHWDVQRGKNVLTLLDRPVKNDDEVITCFRDGEVTLRKNRREDGFTVSFQEIGYQGIEPGDLVVHGMDGFAGAIGVSDSRGKATPVLNVMDSMHNKRFLMYYLRMAAYKDVFMSLSTGIRVRSCDLRWNKLSVFPFILPERQEQDKIVEYIDDSLAKIDDIISEAKASIEEYKVWKASIIYEAVTKGLDPNAEMKDTGISGLGCVPVTWNVTNLKRLATIKTGGTLPKEENSPYYSTEEGLPWIKSENLGSSKPIHNTSEYYTEIALNDIKKFPPYSVYVCCIGSIGKVGFSDIECSCNQQINAVIFDKINWKFGYYAIMAQEEKHWLLSNGNVLKILNSTNQGTIEIAYPNNDEQLVIVNYLDDKCEKIELLISEKETLITELESYKKSLIFEVVTGKRRVC